MARTKSIPWGRMVSLDRVMPSMTEGEKSRLFSDKGKGAEQIVLRCDGVDVESRYARCIKNARERLRNAHPEWVEVFNLVVRNGSNRKESIWRLMSRNRTNG